MHAQTLLNRCFVQTTVVKFVDKSEIEHFVCANVNVMM